MAPRTQTEADIEWHAGLEGIRKRPAVYIGPSNSHGVFCIVREPLDNTVDEGMAGRNKSAHLSIMKDGSFWVVDSGGGIPVGIHKKTGKSTLEILLSEVHSGGKFNDTGAYGQGSRGTHGVGTKATVALSSSFELWTFRDGAWHYIAFKEGKKVKGVEKVTAKPKPPGLESFPKKGTILHFTPDKKIFGTHKINVKDILDWSEISSYLNPKFTISLYNEATGKTKTWYSEEGPVEYLHKLAKESKMELDEDAVFEHYSGHVDVAVGFISSAEENLRGYTNGLYNSVGGTHINAFYAALDGALTQFLKRGETFARASIKAGIVGVVNIKLTTPEFSTQTKEKLIDTRAKSLFQDDLEAALVKFFRKHKELARAIIERAARMQGLADEFKLSVKVASEIKKATASSGKILLPGKLLSAKNCTPAERELYLCEGDSAGGTCDKARDRNFQEVLKLRGKVMNSIRSTDKALVSEAILSILISVGYDVKNKDPLANLRVNRIYFLTDADDDGKHISALLSTLFFVLMPDLYRQGRILTVDAPEYVCTHKDTLYSANSLEDLRVKMGVKELPKTVTHLKGWGEVSAEVLGPIAFDVATRKVIQFEPPDKKQAAAFRLLMADDSAFRKKMLGLS